MDNLSLLASLLGAPLQAHDPYIWLHLAALAWIVFLVYWVVSARKVKAVKRREPRGERLAQICIMATAYVLLFNDVLGRGWLRTRFLPDSAAIGGFGVAVTFLGIAFAIWARRHLGENWSATVTVKEGHELIRSGPYRCIRHPIYTGMLLGFAGAAIALGEYRGLIAVALATANLYVKARKEERFLAREFGQDWEEHKRHTGLFFPKLFA